MSQNCLKFWDKFETKLRTDLRPYRDNLETYLTILLLRANWDIFETWVHSAIAEQICISNYYDYDYDYDYAYNCDYERIVNVIRCQGDFFVYIIY